MPSSASSASDEYQQIEQGSSDPDREQGKHSVLRPASLVALAVGTVGFVSIALFHSQGPTLDRGSNFLAQPSQLGSGLLTCSCPPAEVIWQCSKEEYKALVNGSTCEFYKHECKNACAKNEAGMRCRACSSGLLLQDFCGQCLTQGLNDVGCTECQEHAAPPVLGGDADKHGCRASAGYRWCEAMSSCLRAWEMGLDSETSFKGTCEPAKLNAMMVGGDADSHGCRASAGYQWCSTKNACIRPWEEGLRTDDAILAACGAASPPTPPQVGGDVDANGCRPSAGYQWCPSKNACIRPWEEGCPAASLPTPAMVGGDVDAHGCRPSAGYQWCSSKNACIRPWEEGLGTEDAILAACGAASLPTPAVAGGDADAHGCRPSAGYRWCPTKNACIRPWAEGLHTEEETLAACEGEASAPPPVVVGNDRDSHGCIPSAGYSWCESMSKCIRPWEHGLQSESQIKEKCSA